MGISPALFSFALLPQSCRVVVKQAGKTETLTSGQRPKRKELLKAGKWWDEERKKLKESLLPSVPDPTQLPGLSPSCAQDGSNAVEQRL